MDLRSPSRDAFKEDYTIVFTLSQLAKFAALQQPQWIKGEQNEQTRTER